MEFSDSYTEVEQVILDRFVYKIRNSLPVSMCSDNLLVETWIDRNFNAVILELQMIIAGRVNREVTIKYPEDWWQAVKEHFAPNWFLRRFPIKYVKEVIQAKEFYPDVKFPDKEHFIQVLRKEKVNF